MQTLRGSGNDSSNWVPATQVKYLDGIPVPQAAAAVSTEGCKPVGGSLSLPLTRIISNKLRSHLRACSSVLPIQSPPLLPSAMWGCGRKATAQTGAFIPISQPPGVDSANPPPFSKNHMVSGVLSPQYKADRDIWESVTAKQSPREHDGNLMRCGMAGRHQQRSREIWIKQRFQLITLPW